MPFTQPWFEVQFARSRTGLATVAYRLYKNDGTDSVASTTVGVVEIGNGAYGVPNVTVPDDAVGIEWDTGAAALRYAIEDIEPHRRLAGELVIDGTITLQESLKIILAALANEASGGGTTEIKFRDVGDTQDVLTMTVDENGNRSAVIHNP